MDSDSPSSDTLRVLHLEDCAEDAELVGNTLARDWPNCEIQRVLTRHDFLADLRRGQFDLILSDYSIPGFGGLAALELARQERIEIPFIFLSGTIGEDRAVEALKLGATDYVIKDRPERLVSAIQRALDDARERRSRAVEGRVNARLDRFLQSVEQSDDVFWCAELEARRIVYVSPAFERVWGRPAAALYDDASVWERAIHPEDLGRFRSARAACLSGERPFFEEEYRVLQPDRTERRVFDSGTLIRGAGGGPIRMSGVARDVTGRKRT